MSALAEHQTIYRRVLLGKADVGAGHGLKPRGRRLVWRIVCCLIERGNEALKAPGGDFAEKIAEGREMVFGGGVGDACAAGDFPQTHF